jgi:hypothetical protein
MFQLKEKGISNVPPLLKPDQVKKIRNKYDLLDLELRYDRFLSTNQQVLLLHDLIEEILDIRDAITIQRQRIEREEKKRLYNEGILRIYPSPCNYEHHLQCILPDDLRLTQEQLKQGYMPFPNEPKEYKCGCETIKYVSHCECKKVTSICQNTKCFEKLYPIIKKQSYCITHHLLLKRQKQLEQNLLIIKKEITDIKRHSNSLDFNKVKRVSRYPWKNL